MKLSGRNFPGGGIFYLGKTFHEGTFRGRKEFSMEGEEDFPALFKNDQKLNKKSFVSTGSKEQHQSLKRTVIIP